MPQIIINIPDADEATIVDNFCETHGWTPALGVTKRQFAKAKLIEFIRSSAKSNIQRAAHINAGSAADAVVIT